MTAQGDVGGHRLTSVGLGVASLIMFFAAASLGGMAFLGMPGGSIRIDAADIGALLLAVWLALAGVEMLRRRHFAFAVLTPAALALLNLGYVLATGRLEGLGGVFWMLIPVMVVAGSRSAFRD